MTVKELIEHLKTFDKNLPVVHTMMSDYDELCADDIKEKEVSFRQGRYCSYYSSSLYGTEKPEYRKVIHFPGN